MLTIIKTGTYTPTPNKDVGLFTIGHGIKSDIEMLEQLKTFNIGVLLDVRSRPYSKYNPQYNREAFAEFLNNHDINYVYGGKFLGGLKGPSLNDANFKAKMDAVLHLSKGTRVAMMCSETDPSTCHRAMKLSAYLLGQNPDLKITHILKNNAEIDAKDMQTAVRVKKKTWGWHELFEGGSSK